MMNIISQNPQQSPNYIFHPAAALLHEQLNAKVEPYQTYQKENWNMSSLPIVQTQPTFWSLAPEAQGRAIAITGIDHFDTPVFVQSIFDAVMLYQAWTKRMRLTRKKTCTFAVVMLPDRVQSGLRAQTLMFFFV